MGLFGSCEPYLVRWYTPNVKSYFWYNALSVFFIAVAAVGYWWLSASDLLFSSIPLTDLFLMVLATQRLVRLFTYDIVTAHLRHWFSAGSPDSLRGVLGALLNCPWCTGLWFALLVVFFYFATPIAWYAILVLALSALASFMQIAANAVGWSAEANKKRAQS